MKKNFFIFFGFIFVFIFFCFNNVLAMEKNIALNEDNSVECFDLKENFNLAPFDLDKVFLNDIENFLYYKNLNEYFKGVSLTESEFFKKIFEYYANSVIEKYYSPQYKEYEYFSEKKRIACDFLKNFKNFLIENSFVQDSFKIKIKNVKSKWLELLDNIIKVFNCFKVEDKWRFLANYEGALVLYGYFMFIREFIKYVNNNQSKIKSLYKKCVK